MKSRILLVLPASVLLFACLDQGGGGGSIKYRVENGTYGISNAQLDPNTCNFPESFYGVFSEAPVGMNGDRTQMTVDLDGTLLTYDVSDNDLHDPSSPGTNDVDCTQTAQGGGFACGDVSYDCTLTVTVEFGGMVTGTNAFSLVDSFSYVAKSGAQCDDVAAALEIPSFPCETHDTADFSL